MASLATNKNSDSSSKTTTTTTSSSVGKTNKRKSSNAPKPPQRDVWKVGEEVEWTSSELAQLERILFYENTLDSEKTALVEQFVKISALFPTKCIRDIALKVTQIKKARTSGSLTIGLPSAAACVSSDKDEWIQKTLKENVELINAIRDNLRQERFSENAELYSRFRSNIRGMSGWIDTLGLHLPQTSVRMTTIFEPSSEKSATVAEAVKAPNQGKPPSTGGVLISPAGNPMDKK